MLDKDAIAFADSHKLPNERVARNVLLFVGDGMDMATIGGARLSAWYKDKMEGNKLEKKKGLVFDSFPYFGLAKVCEGLFAGAKQGIVLPEKDPVGIGLKPLEQIVKEHARRLLRLNRGLISH